MYCNTQVFTDEKNEMKTKLHDEMVHFMVNTECSKTNGQSRARNDLVLFRSSTSMIAKLRFHQQTFFCFILYLAFYAML